MRKNADDQDGEGLDEDAFRGFLAERLARFKLPLEIEVLAELPKTAIGKVDKKALV